jgi:heme/copper-type cytochrome/quinol oxidase subunit 4
MQTRSLHLAYLALLLVLGLTITFTFPFSMYFFATIKALIILFYFMHVRHSDEASKTYLILAFALLGVAVFGIWDDIAFRG